MKKIMNFRFALYAVSLMIVSIILSSCLFVLQNLRFVLILAFFGIFLINLICFAIFKKKFLITIAVIFLIGILPVISIYFKAVKIDNNEKLVSETNTFSGKIYKINENLKANKIYVYLEDVSILVDGESEEFYGDVYVILNSNNVDTSKIKLGKFVTIYNSKLSLVSLNKATSERERSYISRGVTATSYVFSYRFHIEDNEKFDLRIKIKNSVYEYFKKTDTFFTDIGYAMIFGETYVLEDEINGVFQDAGIAHLLSVSGFHISVIVAFLSFVLDKLKTNKYLKFSIIGVLIFAYAYLCSFSVSVMRASIMAIMLLYAVNRNKEYDKLSALSLAGIGLLMIDPMQLFNISFIFSFVSILSIILIMPIFERLFSKVFYEKLSSALGLSLAISLGIVVFQLYYFNTFPVLSFLTNLVTVPIVGVLFIFLLISVIVGPVFHLAVPLITVFGVCMKYIIQFNYWIVKHGLYLTCGNFGAVSLLVSLVLMFVVSDYVFLKKEHKICLSGVLFSLLIALIIC